MGVDNLKQIKSRTVNYIPYVCMLQSRVIFLSWTLGAQPWTNFLASVASVLKIAADVPISLNCSFKQMNCMIA